MNRASKETINHTKHTYRSIVFPLVDNESFKAIHKPRNVLQPHKINRHRSETTKQEVSEWGSSFLIHQRKCRLPVKFTLGDFVLAVSYQSPLYTLVVLIKTAELISSPSLAIIVPTWFTSTAHEIMNTLIFCRQLRGFFVHLTEQNLIFDKFLPR